jgi:hypothetical protein
MGIFAWFLVGCHGGGMRAVASLGGLVTAVSSQGGVALRLPPQSKIGPGTWSWLVTIRAGRGPGV